MGLSQEKTWKEKTWEEKALSITSNKGNINPTEHIKILTYRKYLAIKNNLFNAFSPLHIIYYDTSKETTEKFKNRHKHNKNLKITPVNSICELICCIENYQVNPIDLILVDYFGEKPFSKCGGLHVPFKSDNTDSAEVCIDSIIADFQRHKDYTNKCLEEEYITEGISSIYTIYNQFKVLGITDVPVAIYSMLGRRLISSKESAMLQTNGVLWVWKSKERVFSDVTNKETERNTDSNKETEQNIAANYEYDSIHNAIYTGKIRSANINNIGNGLFRNSIIQFITLVILTISLTINLKNTFITPTENNKTQDILTIINQIDFSELLTYSLGVIVILYNILDSLVFKKRLKRALRR